tara:strand:- start:336 stop:1271 length:936 start_codon:yes stop_codon:yes gene_type:complete
MSPPPPEPAGAGSSTEAAGQEWPTLLLLALCFGMLATALVLPAGWGVVGFVLLVVGLTLHSSLTHEILHGHPVRSTSVQTALGVIQPGVFIPYLRFKALHLAHHEDSILTDPYDDPETNYLDPAVWVTLPGWMRQLLRFNNTLLGRMVVGPAVGVWAFAKEDARQIRQGDRRVLVHWLAHIPGVALTLWLVSLSALPLWVYLMACYGALSVLKIRTFLEHRAHERASGRTVVIEDRGPLALLFLNNNYHVVHHMHPTAAWYRLPGLYRSNRAHYLRRNDGYVYPSYGAIFRKYFVRAKDPVAHPLWQDPDR